MGTVLEQILGFVGDDSSLEAGEIHGSEVFKGLGGCDFGFDGFGDGGFDVHG